MSNHANTAETILGEFKGFASIDKNAVFGIPNEYRGVVIGWEHKELKDGIDPDQFVIGKTYRLEGLVK